MFSIFTLRIMHLVVVLMTVMKRKVRTITTVIMTMRRRNVRTIPIICPMTMMRKEEEHWLIMFDDGGR